MTQWQQFVFSPEMTWAKQVENFHDTNPLAVMESRYMRVSYRYVPGRTRPGKSDRGVHDKEKQHFLFGSYSHRILCLSYRRSRPNSNGNVVRRGGEGGVGGEGGEGGGGGGVPGPQGDAKKATTAACGAAAAATPLVKGDDDAGAEATKAEMGEKQAAASAAAASPGNQPRRLEPRREVYPVDMGAPKKKSNNNNNNSNQVLLSLSEISQSATNFGAPRNYLVGDPREAKGGPIKAYQV